MSATQALHVNQAAASLFPFSAVPEFIPDFPLSRVLRPEPDIRDRDGPEYKAFFEQLVADIAERSVQQPILAFREGEMARTLDGWTRCLASLMAAKTTICVLLHPNRPDGKGRLLGSLQSNAMRLDMDDFEYAAVYQQLMDECAIPTQVELTTVVKASPSLVSKRLRLFAGIPADIRCLFGRGPGKLGGRAAYAISRLPSDDDKREIARLGSERGLKVEAIEKWCRDKAGKKPRCAKAVKGSHGGGSYAFPADWGWDRVVAWWTRGMEEARKAAKLPAITPALLPEMLKGE